MTPIRAALSVIGLVALALGLAATLAPGAAPAPLPLNDYLVVVPLGVAAVLAVLGVTAGRARRGVDQASPPDPEEVPTAPAPGADFDRFVASGWRAALPARPDERERVRERLREAAIRTIRRRANCSREEARSRVGRGTWTDDPIAASFLAEGRASRRSARGTVASLVTFGTSGRRRAARTAAAIERAAAGDGAGEGGRP